MFNAGNPVALVENLRQSALEQALLPALLDQLELPADPDCGFAAPIAFDTDLLAWRCAWDARRPSGARDR